MVEVGREEQEREAVIDELIRKGVRAGIPLTT